MNKLKQIIWVISIASAFWVVSANAQITSISQIKDGKPTDKHYQALQSLIERYGVISDNPFRANDPLTREDFVVLLNSGLDQLTELAEDSDEDISAAELVGFLSANETSITSTSQIKDINEDYKQFEHLQSLVERYGIDICDKDKNFRPTKTVTEKEFYTWIAKIFHATVNSNPSATKAITRGEWAIVMNAAFDSVNERIADIAAEKKAKQRDAKDVKPTDQSYKPLQILFDKYEIKLLNENSMFRPNEPVTRDVLLYVLEKGLSKLDTAAHLIDSKITDYYKPYSANNTNIKLAKDVKDYKADNQLKALIETYHIDICDADNNFRGNKSITEKEFYTVISAVFSGKTKREPSATEALTRGEFAVMINLAFESWDSYFAKQYSIKRTNSLTSLGKAQIVDAAAIYPTETDIREPKSKCIDYKNASRDLWQVLKLYNVGGDYTPKNGETGDIVFETTDSCKKGEKVVMMRIGTAIVTMSEKGIKHLK
jgi:hypothetical protein